MGKDHIEQVPWTMVETNAERILALSDLGCHGMWGLSTALAGVPAEYRLSMRVDVRTNNQVKGSLLCSSESLFLRLLGKTNPISVADKLMRALVKRWCGIFGLTLKRWLTSSQIWLRIFDSIQKCRREWRKEHHEDECHSIRHSMRASKEQAVFLSQRFSIHFSGRAGEVTEKV